MGFIRKYAGKKKLLKLSREHADNQEFDKAFQDLETAAKLYSSDNDPLILLEFAHATLKKAESYRKKDTQEYRTLFIQAKKYAEQASAVDPGYAKAYKFLGRIYYHLAEIHKEKSAELELPDSEKALEAAVKLYAESAECFTKARKNTKITRFRAKNRLKKSAQKALESLNELNGSESSERIKNLVCFEKSRLEQMLDTGSAVFKELRPSES